VAAFEDGAYFEQTRQAVIASRQQLDADLRALGFEVLPSGANFVFARHPARAAATLAAGLRERKIIVRHFAAPRISEFLRISVGTPEECAALVAALREMLGK